MEKLYTSQEATDLSDASPIHYFGENWTYEAAFKEQLFAYDLVKTKKLDFKILIGVHAPVYTLGNSVKEKPETSTKIPFVATDRGGQLMYHGPGQLTVYPIFKLKNHFSGPREYSKFIFDLVILHFESKHGLSSKCRNNGLWMHDKKIGFFGLRIKNGITYHGLSLNYHADLNAFKRHSPCDIGGEQAGNISLSQSQDKNFLETEALTLSKSIAHKLTM